MENYKKDFVQFEQVIDPTVKIEFSFNKSHQFCLGYQSINERGKDFMLKFRIVSPKSSQEVVEINHGYIFSVRKKFVVNQNFDKLADFFTFLVLESLNRVNKSLPEGEIEIPPHQSLSNAVFLMLKSKLN